MSLAREGITEEEVLRAILAPGSFMVVVVDKQKAYFGPDSEIVKLMSKDPSRHGRVAGRIDDFLTWARIKGVADIAWVRMYENLEESPDNIRLKQYTGTGLLRNISNSKEESFDYFGLGPEEGEKEFTKGTYDIFGSEEFASDLESRTELKTLVLVGGLTSRCILASAFTANTKGYNVVVVSDLVGVPDTLEFEEEAALSVIDSILGYVVSSESLRDIIKG